MEDVELLVESASKTDANDAREDLLDVGVEGANDAVEFLLVD